MNESFLAAYDALLRHEGGYVADPEDKGGETYKGVSRVFNPVWAGWKIIDKLKGAEGFPGNLEGSKPLQIEVKRIYKANYWDVFAGDQLPPEIASELFEIGVNMGTGRAVLFLQKGLNVLNRNGKLYPDLVEDGAFGPATLATLNAYLETDPPRTLLLVLNIQQGAHYMDYMKASPTQEKYARGWFSRVTLTKRG